ncbi:MAG: TonB-dependent receptor [Rhizobacter sp.]|nr:TonB-dependent receptor [Rhizobacter sp.]
MRHDPRFQIRTLAAAALLALVLPATAQLSSATVRGAVTAETKAQPGATVTATNTANGQVTRTTSRADGSYVLVGLAPGSYKIDIVAPGYATRSQMLTVLIGQTVDLDLALAKAGDIQLQTVTVTGTSGLDRKTSEVGTNVTQKQIDSLPQVTRNFLAFADLAPGVRFDVDQSTGQVKLQSGAQNQDNINIFIDGVSQKNNILRGGASGMDSTRGNPFPQSAIAEYKVISQNYKAEFDQVSSAAITAVTKSGTNELHGEVFWDHTGQNLTAYSPFEARNKANGFDRAKFAQDQYGFTLGGPIKQDVAHFFLSYEGKDIQSPRNIGLASVAALLPNAGLVPGFIAMQGSHIQEFKENLLFGKIDLDLGPNQKLELTGRIRREKDFVAENVTLSAPGNDKNRSNSEDRLDLKHEWSNDVLLNEARLGYEKYEWNPRAAVNAPEVKYFVSPTNSTEDKREFLWAGGSPDFQDRSQKGFLLQDDATYTGMAGHTMKGGAKVKFMSYDLSGTSRAVDIYQKLIDNTTGVPVMFGADDFFQVDRALPSVGVTYKNNQFGVYFQDDWAVSKQLELNLGIRYDYESNAMNDSYVTPADRVAIFGAQDPRDGAPVGQTYAQSLAKGGINIGDYISTGASRKPFTGAIQPRVGFSYDITGDRNMVVFGGIGRAYDRTIANHALDELQKNQQPGGEIWMVRNNHKMPFTDQLSLGLRKGVGEWNTEVGYTYSYAQNQFNWFGGNRDPQGGWGNQSPIDPLWGSVPGFGTLILGDFVSKAKTQTVYLKADKPYSKSSGWGGGVTYTYSDAQTTNKEWTNDIFNWTYGRSTSKFNPSKDVERHRVVASGLTDGLLPWGLLVSGKATLGSGLPYRITDCSKGWDQCVSQKGQASAFRQYDIGIGKEVALGIGKLSFRADIINLFNSVNYGSYDDWGGGPGNPQNYLGGDNGHLGVAGGIAGPMRTVKLSTRYVF